MKSPISTLFLLIELIFFARVILSFVAPYSQHPAAKLIHDITEPILAPIRRVIPPMGGFDLSVLVVFVILNILEGMFR